MHSRRASLRRAEEHSEKLKDQMGNASDIYDDARELQGRAYDFLLTIQRASLYIKLVVKHGFVGGDLRARTSRPKVPSWKHLNVAKDMLFGDRVSSRAFERLKTK